MDTLLSLLCILFILNSYVTFKIIKSDSFDAFQKKTQIVIVWIIPFIAAIGIWVFIRSQDGEVRMNNKNRAKRQTSNFIDSSD